MMAKADLVYEEAKIKYTIKGYKDLSIVASHICSKPNTLNLNLMNFIDLPREDWQLEYCF